MQKTLQVTKYFFRNYYRSRSFYLMLVIDVLICILFIYFSFRYTSKIGVFVGRFIKNPPESILENVFDYIWNFALLYLPVLAAVFFGSPAISSEIEDRTAYHIFPLPISRYSLFAGKFIAAFLVSLVVIFIFLGVEWAVFPFIFHTYQVTAFYSTIYLVVIFLFSILSITFLSSSIFNRNLHAYITVFVAYFLILNAASYIIQILYGYTPSYLLSVAADILQTIYINIPIFGVSSSISIAPASSSTILHSIFIMLAYAFVSLAVAIILFERKEVR